MERYSSSSFLHLLLIITDKGGAVDNQNALSHYSGTNHQIGLESARGSTYWPIRVFSFFVECTEVNAYAYLVMKYFLMNYNTFVQFRKIDKAFIHNSYINEKTCGCTAKTRK